MVVLPPFNAAVQDVMATFMTLFTVNDGIPSTGNNFILKDILRKEWNFKGFVVSDWASVSEMITHGFAANDAEAAMKAINAGVDMEMVSGTYIKEAKQLVNSYKVKEATIDNAVRDILRIKFKLGLFENPYVEENQSNIFYAPEHLAAAKQAAVESAILLKNNQQILPIKSNIKTVAIVGPMANAPYEQLGTWIFDGEK